MRHNGLEITKLFKGKSKLQLLPRVSVNAALYAFIKVMKKMNHQENVTRRNETVQDKHIDNFPNVMSQFE